MNVNSYLLTSNHKLKKMKFLTSNSQRQRDRIKTSLIIIMLYPDIN